MINEIGTLILIYANLSGFFAIFFSFFIRSSVSSSVHWDNSIIIIIIFPMGGCNFMYENYQWTKKGLEGDETKWKLIATFECFFVEGNDHFCDVSLSRHFEDAYNQN